ncbi:unnamed protein product [Polarella glacialis]|uniref:Uncharacterized protein n=1 Tax=Polarella glacialis TaxID=89957 RepID=A0A813LAD3_POLGL|nr:unnamed protein product [Polarella glacialis]
MTRAVHAVTADPSLHKVLLAVRSIAVSVASASAASWALATWALLSASLLVGFLSSAASSEGGGIFPPAGPSTCSSESALSGGLIAQNSSEYGSANTRTLWFLQNSRESGGQRDIDSRLTDLAGTISTVTAKGVATACLSPPRPLLWLSETKSWNGGFLRWLSMCWIDPMMGKPAASGLEENTSVEAVCSDSATCAVTDKNPLCKAWGEEVKEKGLMQASMLRAIYRAIGNKTVLLVLLTAWTTAFLELVGMVVALDAVLTFFEEVSATPWAGPDVRETLKPTLLAILLLFGLPMFYRCSSIAIAMIDASCADIVCSGLTRLLYDKSLRLPTGAAYETPGSDMHNSVLQLLETSVMQEWPQMFRALALLSATPIVAIVLMLLLWFHLGMAGVLGSFYLLAGSLLSYVLVRWGCLPKRLLYQSCQDTRLRRLAELLASQRAVRASGLEASVFTTKIQQAREAELDANQAYGMIVGLLVANLHSTTWFVAVGSLFFHVLLQGGVEARNMWVVLQIVASLQACANLALAGLRRAVTLPTSLTRLENFLKQPERPADVLKRQGQQLGNVPAVRVCGSFAFEEGGPAVLHSLDLAMAQGELVAVLGTTASGKSALLQTLLGELFPCGLAHVVAPSKASYCAQQPWLLQGGTLRENVTLGSEQKGPCRPYEMALAAAALLPDLAELPGCDQAVIGGGGVQLSASQKARVAFARCVFAGDQLPAGDAKPCHELLLIDDLFGCLPDSTAEEIFQHLLLAPQLCSRTRIVVFSRFPQLQQLRRFDRLVVLREGHVVAEGSPERVLASKACQELILCHPEVPVSSQHHGQPIELPAHHPQTHLPREIRPLPQNKAAKAPETALETLHQALLSNVKRDIEEGTCSGKYMQGKVQFDVGKLCGRTAFTKVVAMPHKFLGIDVTTPRVLLRAWLQAGGIGRLSLVVLLLVAQRAAQLWQMLTLAMWGDAAMRAGCNHRAFAFKLLFAVLLNCVFLTANECVSYNFSRRAGEAFHSRALQGILDMPLDSSLHRTRLNGDILGRMSTDMAQIDSTLVTVMLTGLRNIVGTVVQQAYIVSIVPKWLSLGIIVPAYLSLLFFARLYRRAVVSLNCCFKNNFSSAQRLSISPEELVCIRANKTNGLLFIRHAAAMDAAVRAGYLNAACRSWISLRATLCLSIGASACGLHVLLTAPSGHLGVGSFGLTISLFFACLSDFESVCDLIVQSALVFSAMERVAELWCAEPRESTAPETSTTPICTTFVPRISLMLPHEELLPGMQLQSWPGGAPALVSGFGGPPLFTANNDGTALKVLCQTRLLLELSPRNAVLRQLVQSKSENDFQSQADQLSDKDGFCIVTVNGVSGDAKAMAQELVTAGNASIRNGSNMLSLELGHQRFLHGAQVEVQGLSASRCNRVDGGEEDVVRALTFDVPPCGRVAIAGPPGCGKSALLSCILRLAEPDGGRVMAGGCDVRVFDLEDLRARTFGFWTSRDPAIFEGTWRENLDPQGRHCDDDIWTSLASVGLADHVQGLHSPISQSGSNLSLRQRQLLSLARQVLRQPPVLLLEADSALVPAAAQALQAALESSFQKSTVILATESTAVAPFGFTRVIQLRNGVAVNEV